MFYLEQSLVFSKQLLVDFYLHDFLYSSYEETLSQWFYFNTSAGTTQWNHPLDDIYKDKVEEARKLGVKSNNSKNLIWLHLSITFISL